MSEQNTSGRQRGVRGGDWALARSPEKITLKQVRNALAEEASFPMHRNEPHPKCMVEQNVRGVLERVYADADDRSRLERKVCDP